MSANGSSGQNQPIQFPPRGNSTNNTSSNRSRGSPGSPRRRRKPVSQNTPRFNGVQWVILFIVTLLTILLILTPAVLFYFTKNPISLTSTVGIPFIGYVWYRIVHYSFPKTTDDYKMKELSIKYPYQKPRNKNPSP